MLTDAEREGYYLALLECPESLLLQSIKAFLESESVFYHNTDEDMAPWHARLPLKHFGLSALLTDDYRVLFRPREKNRTGNILITMVPSQNWHQHPQTFELEIESYFSNMKTAQIGYRISWGWAHKHCHYDGNYLYDCFVTQFFRKRKLERILQ